MRHFLRVKTREEEIKTRQGKKVPAIVIYPSYVARSNDLMRKGGKFYAVYKPSTGLWSTNESDLVEIIDSELYAKRDQIGKVDAYGNYTTEDGTKIVVKSLDDSETNKLKEFNLWMSNLSPNHAYVPLDSDITYIDDKVSPEDYRSKRLKYRVAEGSIENYDHLMSTLYSEENRRKIEWSIGSVFSGDSKEIEKILVLYGDPGTGKSTVLDLIKKLFEGYWSAFVAAELVSKTHQFGTAAFKDNPLVAIQDDGSLAKIEAPMLNEIVSHKETTINEKGKQQYTIKPHAFLFLATNELIDIHDTKLGITRRLLDVYPSGNRLGIKDYRHTKSQLKFELGAIAYHCLQVYKEMGKDYYEGYIPSEMINKTNYLRNFMFDKFEELKKTDPITRDMAYMWYKQYFEDSGLGYPPRRIIFGEQLKEYYKEYSNVKWLNGKTTRHVFSGLREDKILGFSSSSDDSDTQKDIEESWLDFKEQESIFDKTCSDCPAQYASDEEKPMLPWNKVVTTLDEIDTSKLHYVRVPKNHIVIDFDIKDENGNKSLAKNLEAASKWPKTYAELSKSGSGIHLHYIYDGDVDKLSRIYDDNVEVKVFTGKSSLRRKLTKCVNLAIAIISSGLPLKGGKEVVNYDTVKNEKGIRTVIKNCLEKKHHGATKPEVDLIFKTLEDAYSSGISYDVSDLKPAVFAFANNSTNQAVTCIKLVNKMHFCSEVPRDNEEFSETMEEAPIVFFDVEVLPNLFIICWKKIGEDSPVVKMINPSASEVEKLFKFRLVGFNNRRYDNHICYARFLGYSEEQLFELSKKIISGSRNVLFREAYNLSYTDIYDFCAKKQSLKKWEIELGIHHQELGLPWDMPVPEDMWTTVADYCCNDVIATEAVWNKNYGDFVAREILADIAGLTVNDTTNTLTGRIIFGNDRHPQDKFVYTNLEVLFPGYKYSFGKSSYMGEDPGEGGYVYAEPGMYGNVALLDVASMHPTSIEQLDLFGPYTAKFSEIKQARIYIKHKDYDSAGKLFDGKLKKYLTDSDQADALSYALKIAINSVYGLTSAKFDNLFKDPRNVDNIVAKRGALFMINLKHEVKKRGYVVAHIKTDSIKIPDADPEIIKFVMDYGKQFGYTFEHEATYDRMCLVNNAVYIARYADPEKCEKMYNYIPGDNKKHPNEWTATGAQFQQPYVFKSLFSKEQIQFGDMCETRAVNSGELYLDLNENLPEEEHNYHYVGKVGQFCPIKPGCGGGILYRRKDDKNYAATNTTGYRWLESEVVSVLGKQKDIDKSFYKEMIDAAVHDISEYGDFEWFVSDEPYNGELKIPITAEKEYTKQVNEIMGDDIDDRPPFN